MLNPKPWEQRLVLVGVHPVTAAKAVLSVKTLSPKPWEQRLVLVGVHPVTAAKASLSAVQR